MEIGVKTNTNFTNTTGYASAGSGFYTPAVSYNNNNGVGIGYNSPQGTNFAYPWMQQKIEKRRRANEENGVGSNGGINGWLSDIWNNSAIGKIIPDVIYANESAALTYLGGGSYVTGIAIQLKGKEGFNIYSTLTLNGKAGGHFALYSWNAGFSSYTGDSRNFSFMESFCGQGTRGLELDLVYGISGSVSPMDAWGARLYSYDAGIGLGVGASMNVGSVTYALPVLWPWNK
jgi:hypothetical protein